MTLSEVAVRDALDRLDKNQLKELVENCIKEFDALWGGEQRDTAADHATRGAREATSKLIVDVEKNPTDVINVATAVRRIHGRAIREPAENGKRCGFDQ